MHILCDTCSVLMLIRIVPDMFIDSKYECGTITEVIHEIYRSARFKSKYPWRDHYKDKIKPISDSIIKTDNYSRVRQVVQLLIENGTVNPRTGKFFDLSRVDQIIAACVISNNYSVSTVDNNLMDFIIQQFDKSNLSPLYLLNTWIKKGFLKWNENFRTVLEDWDKCNESPQPKSDIKEFEKLVGCKYPGP